MSLPNSFSYGFAKVPLSPIDSPALPTLTGSTLFHGSVQGSSFSNLHLYLLEPFYTHVNNQLDDGGNKHFLNVWQYLGDYTVLRPVSQPSSWC